MIERRHRKTLSPAILAGVIAVTPRFAAGAQPPILSLPFEQLAANCAPQIHPTTLKGLIYTESSWNPYAIGIVGGRLERQPRTHAQAVAAAKDLDRRGYNFSMGLGQVNRYNLAKYGETYETVFEPCRNLKAGGAILKDCYDRAKRKMPSEQRALRAAISCYYSGNFTRGFRPDKPGEPSYVQKVVANAAGVARPIIVVPAIQPPTGSEPVRAERPTPTSSASPNPAAPAQWVIFASAAPAEVAVLAPADTAGAQAAAIKVQLATPAAGADITAVRAATAPAVAQPALPAPMSGTVSGPPATPFVQFFN
ncbi:VirB1 [Cupriavidus basilensis OR16]|uniref:VirB1 n=1 Tax=Cupriavidus basilensis OR16 TaxID=1127483 RepID=H1RZV5_9BURK|nr:lytic transglycosylase domain-containing protein [Cupriavidus basilensis]EHP44171.1 VirB1 [Cupriavidus basilensis OR16]